VFGVASILTPFFLAGDDRRRRVGTHPSGNHAGDSITSWFNPMSMLFAFAGVVSAAFIAAVFLVSDAQRYGAPTSRPTFAAGRSSRPAYSF
jgi:cytochrome bd ubiquinol oxidase subunit II